MRIGRRYRKHLKMMAALSMQVRFFNSCSDDVTLSQRPTPKKNLNFNHRDDLQRRPGRQQSLTKGGEPTQSEAHHAELVERQVERGIEIFLAKRPWSPTGTGTEPEESDDRSVTILREAKTQPKIKRTRRIWRKILKDGVVDRLKKGPRIPKSHRRRQQGSSRRRRQQGSVPADRDQNKRQGSGSLSSLQYDVNERGETDNKNERGETNNDDENDWMEDNDAPVDSRWDDYDAPDLDEEESGNRDDDIAREAKRSKNLLSRIKKKGHGRIKSKGRNRDDDNSRESKNLSRIKKKGHGRIKSKGRTKIARKKWHMVVQDGVIQGFKLNSKVPRIRMPARRQHKETYLDCDIEVPDDETMMEGDIRSRLTDMSDQEIQDFFNSTKRGVAGGNQGFEEYLQFVVGQLDELGMELSDVPRDGDCLLHAFHRARADSQPREVFSRQSREAVDQLRQNVVEFLRGSLTDEDATDIGLTLDHSAGDETEIISKDVYLCRLADPGVYMGQTEVKALSDMFQVGINLITGKV